jgi:hypothetical protein
LATPQIPTRTVFLIRSTRSLKFDVIRTDDGAFDAGYFREFVRNKLESTTGLQPVRRGTRGHRRSTSGRSMKRAPLWILSS